MFRKKQKLQLALNDMRKQATDFLISKGFPADEEHLALFAMNVMHSPDDQDYFEPVKLEAKIRKAIASRTAFYLLHPDKAPKDKENVTEEPAGVTTEVV